MLFNSLEFVIFFAIVYTLYLLLNHKWQNKMLLAASYIFYGSWDWRFLSLILISTALDYFCGRKIHALDDTRKKRLFLLLSIVGNLSILGFFKYFNFFASNLAILLDLFGIPAEPRFLNIILPVGISFYTFQTMSYSIDIYRGLIKPTHKFADFALFVAFFPQLLAGPIERAKNLLPQILSPRTITLAKFYEGAYLIFWGLFQKIFIADNLAKLVQPVFDASPPYSGEKVLLASYAFAFQIFCDFAGYSNIARGLAKCMGFELMVNFRLPYITSNPLDFWKKWHISLYSWLRDYVYIPMTFANGKRLISLAYLNTIIIMVLGGLWHGASWNFIIWGAYHGVIIVLYKLLQPVLRRIPEPGSKFGQRIWFAVRVFLFFNLLSFGSLIFRSGSLKQFFYLAHGLFFNFSISAHFISMLLYMLYFLWLLILIQILQYLKKDFMFMIKWPVYLKTIFVLVVIYLNLYVFILGVEATITGGNEFFYFQF